MSSTRSTRATCTAIRALLLGIALQACVASAQQRQLGLQITSPSDNTVVNPGQPVSITVVSVDNLSIQRVFVTGQIPIGSTTTATSIPAQLSLTIPQQIALGRYLLTAWGATTGGQLINSAPVTVDVERSDLPTRLSSLRGSSIMFASQAGREPIKVLATFSDGTQVNVTESSNLTFSSSNTDVATVDAHGIVKPISQGTATVTATYAQGNQSVKVSISVTVPKPIVKPSPSSLNFGNQNVGTRSAAQTITLTNAVFDPTLVVGPVSTFGDFSASDDCQVSSPVAPGTSCTATVTFKPTLSGTENGTLFVPNSLNGSAMEIFLTGTGIGQSGTSTTIASSTNPTVYGQPTTLSSTVSVSGGTGTPTGSVTFNDGANPLGSASLSNAQANLTISSLSAGPHSLSAAYSGDSNFPASTSSPLSQVVNPASTVTALSSTSNPSTLNGSITLTASLSVVSPGAGTPTGTISFQDGSSVLEAAPVNAAGQATFSTTSLSVGAHSLLASYSGDSNFQASSGTLTQQIAYGICVLYDQTRSVNAGAIFPLKLYLCDGNGNDVSTPSIVVHATSVSNISGYAGPVESPGNANPDNDFRYDSTQGPAGGYMFNLDTSGLGTGTYSVQFTAGADPTPHAVNFGVK